ncbi:MAG: tyrosine-type recombinase/integrase [Burkholderiales bacterium]|nr:tyrosine-type recombinase/integrase [Burkholderiales bacterium]
MFNIFSRAPTVAAWAQRHVAAIERDVAAKKLRPTVLYNTRALCAHITAVIGTMRMDAVTPPDVMRVVRAIQAQGFQSSAQRACLMLRRLHYEAIEEGVIPADCNPARAIRLPRAPIQRNRLTLDQWRRMIEVASVCRYPYLYRAMLLEVVTGQRRGDIVMMRYEHIVDGCLRVEQAKTGARVAIPLALRCDAIGLSLDDVVRLCRCGIISPYLLHVEHKMRGQHVNASLISVRFARLRDAVLGKWVDDGTPPTFHEQRSLAERLYAEQGLQTRKLLGHRRQHMTDVYNSDRRLREWVTIPL